MEEIPNNHLRWCSNPVNNRVDYHINWQQYDETENNVKYLKQFRLVETLCWCRSLLFFDFVSIYRIYLILDLYFMLDKAAKRFGFELKGDNLFQEAPISDPGEPFDLLGYEVRDGRARARLVFLEHGFRQNVIPYLQAGTNTKPHEPADILRCFRVCVLNCIYLESHWAVWRRQRTPEIQRQRVSWQKSHSRSRMVRVWQSDTW